MSEERKETDGKWVWTCPVEGFKTEPSTFAMRMERLRMAHLETVHPNGLPKEAKP